MQLLSLVFFLALFFIASPARADRATLGDRFRTTERFILDESGRVILFHGVNLVQKTPPYFPAAAGFGEEDAKIMADAGWNIVRLGVLHAGVEPEPGKYDETYLEQIEQTVALFGRYGIYSLLDFHQDLYGPVFQGDGIAPWATLTDSLPLQPSFGFPDDYFKLPALQRAFDHFWNNSPGPGDIGLQDRYAAAWQHVAKRFSKEPWVIGYDLFNEPFPGSSWKSCTPQDGCSSFDPVLGEFQKKVAKAIEAVDMRHLIFFEPPVLFGLGIPSQVPRPPGDRVVFSFHNYWPKDFSVPLRHASDYARNTKSALMMTEFGASVDPAPVQQVLNLADQNLLSWVYWAYANKTPFKIITPGLPATPEQQGIVLDLKKPRTGSNLNAPVLRALTRPYPSAIAGTPLHFHYDQSANLFELSYSKTPVSIPLRNHETLVVVPLSLYPKGYRVAVSGATVLSPSNAKLLRLRNDDKSASVSLKISPP